MYLKRNNFNQQSRAQCYPTNSQIDLTKHQFNKSPCGNGYIFNEPIPYEALQKDYAFYGDSNYNQCVEDVRELFNKQPSCSIPHSLCESKIKDVKLNDLKKSKFLVI